MGAAALAVAGGAALFAANTGSGTAHSAAPAAATSATTEPAMTQASGPTVMTKHDAKLGTILADANGLTLYTLTNNGKAVDCTGTCAAVWPPLTASSAMAPSVGPAGTSLGVASLSDGTRVVSNAGLPLYRFSQDHDSGDAYGEGLATFGGVWHVVKVGQSAPATQSAARSAPPATMYKTPATMSKTPATMSNKPATMSTTPATMYRTPATTASRTSGWGY